ncbi:MAG: segregation ATPase FtsK/SpoIIIE, family, partial [Gaiellaceae bacterium]|nr:segregation ATPase FtsK/SpoIIIE, family [Gaiellaceae bacterium]
MPHSGHVWTSDAPHAVQKHDPDVFSVPHVAQMVAIRRVYSWTAQGMEPPASKLPFMPAKRKKRPPTKRTPSRVKKRRVAPKRSRASHQHPELIGLGLVAVGVFLAAVLYLGWNGGVVGHGVVHGVRTVIGAAAYGLPAALVALGGLMLFRSSTVDVRPFRRGLTVLGIGLLLVLGHSNGGKLGAWSDAVVGRLVGRTGVVILGVLALLVGSLVLSNLSLGAWLRRSHAAARTMRARRPKRTPAREPLIAEPVAIAAALAPPIDAVADYPDALHDEPATDPVSVMPPLLPEREPLHEDPPTLFDLEPTHSDYKLPDRTLLRHSPEKSGPSPEANQRIGDALVETLSHFGVDAKISGQISGPRVTRYELQLAPGTKVAKVAALKDDLSYALATTEIRILAPIPGK